MTVAVLATSGDGNIQEGTFVGGAGDYTNVHLPDDDDTSYITTDDNPGNRFHSMYVQKLPTADIINSVICTYRRRRINGTTWYSQVGLRSGTTNSLAAEVGNESNSWATITSPAISRPGGGSFTNADFPGGGSSGMQLLLSVGSTSGSGADGGYTTAYLNVDFNPAGGGFTLYVAQWLLPLLGAASHALLKREMVEILSNLRVRPSSDEEFARLLEAFKVRPRFAI